MSKEFALKPVSIEELEAAEASLEFASPLLPTNFDDAQIIDFAAINKRCNDTLKGQIAIKNNIIKGLHLEASGCALSRASIVTFSQQIINVPIAALLALDDQDFIDAVGSNHPLRNDCILYGIKALKNCCSRA